MKFLTLEGLTYFASKITALLNKKVDKDGSKTLSDNNYSNAEKEKLAGIAESANKYVHPTSAGNKHVPAGGTEGQILGYGGSSGTATWMNNNGQANVLEKVSVNGTALPITSKGVNIDLTGYARKTDISSVYKSKGSVANYAALPAANNTVGDVYNLEDTGANYVWIGGNGGEKKDGWDNLGMTIDLALFVKSEDLTAISTSEIDAMFV